MYGYIETLALQWCSDTPAILVNWTTLSPKFQVLCSKFPPRQHPKPVPQPPDFQSKKQFPSSLHSTHLFSNSKKSSSSKMYARKASELVKELTCSEPGQLSAFNSDLFAQVIEEWNSHYLNLEPLMSKITELKKIEALRQENNQELDETEKKALQDHSAGALIHHFSLLRNKRCLMAYVYHRAEMIRNLSWTVERVLPEEIEEKISSSEKEYFKKHTKTIQSYMSQLDLDLAVDMVPPKDPYIKVRVLDDIGNVVLSDQSANLVRHAILFLRRTDAEQYISQGLMEELTS